MAAPVGSWTIPVMVALVPCPHITLASAVQRKNAETRPHDLNIHASRYFVRICTAARRVKGFLYSET
jgi:hypothetical protein